jgi:hypothetical protein
MSSMVHPPANPSLVPSMRIMRRSESSPDTCSCKSHATWCLHMVSCFEVLQLHTVSYYIDISPNYSLNIPKTSVLCLRGLGPRAQLTGRAQRAWLSHGRGLALGISACAAVHGQLGLTGTPYMYAAACSPCCVYEQAGVACEALLRACLARVLNVGDLPQTARKC